MGKPKIYDLAEQMINLSGLKIKISENPNGDIEIITGLDQRKTLRNFLIDGDPEETMHPYFKANETTILPSDFEKCL